MNAQGCLNMLREIKDVSFATSDKEGKPHNRIIDVMLVEENALIFCTGRGKNFYSEIIDNPYVSVCGMNKNWQMFRLEGKAEKLAEQKKYIDKIFQENPSMNDVYPSNSRYILDAFAIKSGNIEYFDLGVHPIKRESFTFGENAEKKETGFLITDTCIGCGTCLANCPQQCIEEGTPFAINQSSCLHCGLCFENCPVGAIERLGKKC